MRQIRKIIFHCSASDYPKQSAEWLRKIAFARGFDDISYHYVVNFDGSVEKGRNESEIGAHCQGHNHDSIGVCLTGMDNFTEEQFASLRELAENLLFRYPKATIHGHHEFNQNKTCPRYSVIDALTNEDYQYAKPE